MGSTSPDRIRLVGFARSEPLGGSFVIYSYRPEECVLSEIAVDKPWVSVKTSPGKSSIAKQVWNVAFDVDTSLLPLGKSDASFQFFVQNAQTDDSEEVVVPLTVLNKISLQASTSALFFGEIQLDNASLPTKRITIFTDESAPILDEHLEITSDLGDLVEVDCTMEQGDSQRWTLVARFRQDALIEHIKHKAAGPLVIEGKISVKARESSMPPLEIPLAVLVRPQM
jgi:hypothetical protein